MDESTIVGFILWLIRHYGKVDQLCRTQALTTHVLFATGSIRMASKQSPEPKLMEPSLSLSEQANSKKAKLPCIGFLKTHFEERGLDEKGYKMLHRMIEMISAIGFEMHVIYSSKIPSEGSKLKIQRYLSCISQGCEAFSKNMNAAVEKAENASRVLPKLEGTLHELQLKLQQWETELRYRVLKRPGML